MSWEIIVCLDISLGGKVCDAIYALSYYVRHVCSSVV